MTPNNPIPSFSPVRRARDTGPLQASRSVHVSAHEVHRLLCATSPLLRIPINALGAKQGSLGIVTLFPTSSQGKGKIGGAGSAIKPNRRFLTAMFGTVALKFDGFAVIRDRERFETHYPSPKRPWHYFGFAYPQGCWRASLVAGPVPALLWSCAKVTRIE
jgi:hypothetical protein